MKHFIDINNFSKIELRKILNQANKIKKNQIKSSLLLKNKSLGMLFEKQSTRTRISFSIGMQKLGGNVIELDSNQIGFGKRESIEEILNNTDVNTLVIDVKTDNGHILFDTDIDEVLYLNNERVKFTKNDLQDLREIKDLYLVGRLVVFQDPLFAKVFPDEAVFDSRLNKPYSQNGQFFLDPSSEKVRNYIINIAVESCRLGFDEIQYDYIRYPDSSSKFMQFDTKNDFENRVDNINSFLSKSRQLLHNEGCLLSADTFGYILTNKQDGGIGQNLETIVQNVDFISPMVYPSHYTNGSFGYQNPNNHPYEVITAALTDALDRGVDKNKIRPFLQGFWDSNEDIRNNIKAASDLGMDWLIWNILSVYELDSFTKLSQ